MDIAVFAGLFDSPPTSQQLGRDITKQTVLVHLQHSSNQRERDSRQTVFAMAHDQIISESNIICEIYCSPRFFREDCGSLFLFQKTCPALLVYSPRYSLVTQH